MTTREKAPASICLIGGGEHARVVADLLSLLPHFRLSGYWGPNAEPGMTHLGDDWRLRGEYSSRWSKCFFHLGMAGKPGENLRKGVFKALEDLSLKWATLLHPRAFVSPLAKLGEGCFIGANAVVHTDAWLGDQVIVNTAAVVEHDARIATGVHVAPGAVVGGGVEIGAWAVLGLGCRVRDHVRIGAGAVVGMGAVVIADVEPGEWVVGIPARPLPRGVSHA